MLAKSIPLGAVDPRHPTLWGEVEIKPEPELLVHRDAKIFASYRTGSGENWWERRKQGAITKDGRLIEELTDWRGGRAIYPWIGGQAKRAQAGIREQTVLYGGTLYDHFGHLLLDLTRLYQLLPLFRHSQLPFWLHYQGEIVSGEIQNQVALEWLDCLGIRDRVRIVEENIRCELLISSPVLYRDRCFVTSDFARSTRRSLKPSLRSKLQKIKQRKNRVAYLSRTSLTGGTSQFLGEAEVIEQIRHLTFVDIYTPEQLTIKQKLRLFMQYDYVVGFIQASMLLKYFLPQGCADKAAQMITFTAGPNSLNSNWVNLTKEFGFLDFMIDCTCENSSPSRGSGDADASGFSLINKSSEFQRSVFINHKVVVNVIRQLGGLT